MPSAPKPTSALVSLRGELQSLADPVHAQSAAKFFKTGPGQYAEDDVLLGISVPKLRKVARKYPALTRRDLTLLLQSKLHEERAIALFILVQQYENGDAQSRLAVFAFYMDHLAHVNNWDLVDASAAQIVGANLLITGDRTLLPRLAKSKVMWERRIAMVATYAFIRAGEAATAIAIAKLLLKDEHDLIHKAVGWMLREVGKRVSVDILREFLQNHAPEMPRTALRYAIEHLPKVEQKRWLANSKGRPTASST